MCPAHSTAARRRTVAQRNEPIPRHTGRSSAAGWRSGMKGTTTMQIPAFVRQHPGWTAFAVGSVALGAANAAAPENDFVKASNTVSLWGGLAAGVFGSGPVAGVGMGLLGASLIGQAVGRATA